MVGQTISHYELIETVGEGGMGVVYKARDTLWTALSPSRFCRPTRSPIADRKLRFVQEAKAASALNHPNIITIHEIGCEDGATSS